MDKFVKLAIVVGALLAGFGIFYHYVIFLPGIEHDKAAAATRQKQDTEAREAQRQVIYEGCISAARRNYDANWAAACTSVAQSRAAEFRNCLSDRLVMTNQFMGAEYCKRTYGETDASPECTLPKARADSINATQKQAQEKCVTEARLGLQ